MIALAEAVQFVAACGMDELPVGLGRAFVIGRQRVAIFRTRGGKIFAVANECPHRGGPLADGMLVGDQVVCPMHAFRYDSKTGGCDQNGTCAVQTFDVEIVGTVVKVGIPAA